jgi:hypothetical protein
MVRRTGKRKNVEGIEEMSKGSRPRPLSIPLDELNNRLGNIFGEKPKKQRWVPPPLPEDMQGIKSSFEQQLGTTKLPPGRT